MNQKAKKITKVLQENHVKAMVSALKKAGIPVKEDEVGYVVTCKGFEVFRAMKGSTGYIVRHDEELFSH